MITVQHCDSWNWLIYLFSLYILQNIDKVSSIVSVCLLNVCPCLIQGQTQLLPVGTIHMYRCLTYLKSLWILREFQKNRLTCSDLLGSHSPCSLCWWWTACFLSGVSALSSSATLLGIPSLIAQGKIFSSISEILSTKNYNILLHACDAFLFSIGSHVEPFVNVTEGNFTGYNQTNQTRYIIYKHA